MAEHKISKISHFTKGIKHTTPTRDIQVIDALNHIKSEQNKGIIEQLRTEQNKTMRGELKKNLGYYTFSGTFKKRGNDYLIKHSGLICIDLDDLDIVDNDPEKRDPGAVLKIKETLSKDPYVLAMFISPSGNGLKLLVRIDPMKHLESFLGLEKYIRETYSLEIDPSGKDVSRACYQSYDPEVYINDNSKPFTDIVDQHYEVDEDTGEVFVRNSGDLEGMVLKLREQYKRAKYVTDRIEQASVDITPTYEYWLHVGMALSVFGEPGRELFHRVSQWSDTYKPSDTERKFDDLLRTSKFTTPAKFFSIAKEFGVNVSAPKTVPAEDPDSNKNWKYFWPDGCTETDELKAQVTQFGFFEFKSKVYIAHANIDKSHYSFMAISNYTLSPLFLIPSKNDPKRLFEIKNIYGASAVVDLPQKALGSPQTFQELTEGQGNFLFDAAFGRKELSKLKKFWYLHTKTAHEIKVLGWQKEGFYAFANGVFYQSKFHPIDDYGIIEHRSLDEDGHEVKKHFFIPAMSSIYRDEDEQFEDQKKFVYLKQQMLFKEWAAAYCKLHKHNHNGMISLSWYLSTLYRDFIYRKFKSFPHLFGFGPPGTGKSRLAWSLVSLFGHGHGPFNLNAGTPAGFYRAFSQFKNAVKWFDEYSNDIDMKRIQELKSAYDGAGHIKAEWSSSGPSNNTQTTQINSACYISGQQLPIADNALFKRVILLQFYQTEYSEEEREFSNSLAEMEEKSFSYITAGLTSFRPLVEEKYDEAFEVVIKDLKKAVSGDPNIEERIIQNMAVCLAVFKVLENEIEFPFTWPELLRESASNILSQNKLISKSKETSQFWEQVQYLYANGVIKEGDDFVIKKLRQITLRVDRNKTAVREFEEPRDLMIFSMTRIHPEYMKSLRNQGEKKGMDRQSILHYLQHSFKGYIGAVNKIEYGERTTSGFVVDYGYLESLGFDFDKPLGKKPDGVPTLHVPTSGSTSKEDLTF